MAGLPPRWTIGKRPKKGARSQWQLRPTRRETAERLIAEVVERARMINRDSSLAYRVRLLAVFGSALTGKVRPNDVDIACRLAPRFAGEKQEILEDERRASRGFINTFEWAVCRPKLGDPVRNSSRDREGYRFRILEFLHWRESITSWCSQTIKVGIEPANLVVQGVEEVPVVECQLLPAGLIPQ